MLVALVLAALTLRLAPRNAMLPEWLPIAIGLGALAWPALRPANVTRDDTLPALAVLLSSIGLAVVARLNPELAQKQIVWLSFSLILAIAAGPAFTRFRVLAAYKYIWILGTIALFVALALFGHEVNGARLWIRLGPIQFEPVEVIKLLVVLFMASYLADTADVIARTRPWSLRANAKYLGPLFLGWGVSMGILVLQRDIGMASLLLATFVAMLYVATRRIDSGRRGDRDLRARGLVGGDALRLRRAPHRRLARPVPRSARRRLSGGAVAVLAGQRRPVRDRLRPGKARLHPRRRDRLHLRRIRRGMGRDRRAGTAGVYLALVLRALRVAARQPDLYAKLLATGLAAVLGFQILIIVGGVLHMFPLTGITLPFISYGGSSLVTNFLLVALVWAISSERRAPPRGG